MIFGAVSAWHQLGLFIMGIAFMGVGGGILGWELYWRIMSYKINGIITGINVNHKQSDSAKKNYTGEMYHSVLSFTLPNGQKREQVSPSASGFLMGRLPGKKVKLMVFPSAPEKTRRPSLILLLFGSAFFLPGVYVMSEAIRMFEFNMSMVLVVGAVFGYIAYKCYPVLSKVYAGFKQMSPEEWEDGLEELKEQGIRVRSSSSAPVESSVPLSKAEIMARLRVRYKRAPIFIAVFGLIAVGLLGGSYYAGISMWDRLQNGKESIGEVVRIRSEYNNSSEGSSYTYYSVIQFIETDRNIEFEDNVGASHALHDVGEKVSVLYYPYDPDDAIIDRGVFNWGLSGGLLLGALLFLWAAMFHIRAMRFLGRL
ncbi:MAG: DUF3592 domain-containing protein [Alphaproteobacteria bacterium]